MYVRTYRYFKFWHDHEKLIETEKVDRSVLFWSFTTRHSPAGSWRRAFDLCLEGLSCGSYDQRRSTHLSTETQDATATGSFSQPLVPIAENWKMANIAAVAGSFDS